MSLKALEIPCSEMPVMHEIMPWSPLLYILLKTDEPSCWLVTLLSILNKRQGVTPAARVPRRIRRRQH
jgi:hypothetical protein